MAHPVLSDRDITSAITLIHENGSRTSTRGQLTRGPEREDAAEAPGRLMIQAETPTNTSRVLIIMALSGRTWDVLESDPSAAGLETAAFSEDENWDSTSYFVRSSDGSIPPPTPSMVDFDPPDFDSTDFN